MPNWLHMIAVRFEPGSSHTAVGRADHSATETRRLLPETGTSGTRTSEFLSGESNALTSAGFKYVEALGRIIII